MAIVFIDVFFIYNFIINLILLISTKLMCFAKAGILNIVFGAFVGAFYSVCHMIFQLNGIVSYLINIASVCAVVYISFVPKTLKSLIKNSAAFFCANFIYGGAMFFLVYFFNIGIHFGGGIFYVDIPIAALILSATAVYGLIFFTKHVLEKKMLFSKKICSLEITVGSKTFTVDALCDTGNSLFEPISGAPVIFIEEDIINRNDINISTYRFVPYKSAGGSGCVMAFAPDSVKIDNKKTDILVYAAIFSGILSKDGEYHAILHPFLMSHSSEIKEMCSVDI